MDDLNSEIQNVLSPDLPGSRKSSSYMFRSSMGPKLYITITYDEFYTIEGMIINHDSSGTSMHNVCNALGRAISVGIQGIRKANSAKVISFIQKMIENLSGFSSESLWMSDTLGNANSIPDVISRVLDRHIKMTEALEEMHTDEEDNG